MNFKLSSGYVAAIAALLITSPVAAETSRSKVAFNTGIGEKTAAQPMNGVEVAYQVALRGGDFEGCTVDIVETMYGRDEGRWGIFDIAADVTCADGVFAYTSSGAWDANGFHAAGEISNGSGRDAFAGIAGRIAQIGGGAVPAEGGDGTLDVSYELIVEPR